MPSYPLNKSQTEAVEYTNGPLLIVAGAGTGKTTVITHKIVHLIESGLARPEEVLAVTFTEKATHEMEERVDGMLIKGTFDLWISTFHGLAERILESHALHIGLPNNFKLLDEVSAWLLVRQNLDKFNLDYYRPMGNPTRFIHQMIKHFQRCKDELIGPEEYLEYAEKIKLDTDNLDILSQKSKKTRHTNKSTNEQEQGIDVKRIAEIANAYHAYNRILLENNALDFADLLFYAVKLFKERPNVLKSYQDRFKFILVDEFQDTNWAQYDLVKLLSAGGSQLTVVGDDDQSIYKFRGASVSNILQFKSDFPKAKEVVLTENYRSYQDILDKAYNLIQLNNPDRLETKLKVNKRLIASRSGKGLFELMESKGAFEEAQLTAEKLVALKQSDSALAWKDFAILCRANSFAEPFIAALQRLGIPYEFAASVGLYKDEAVLDSLALFRLVDNYHESKAVYRLLASPICNLSYEDISRLLYACQRNAISLYESLNRARQGTVLISGQGKEIAEKFLSVIQKCADIAGNQPAVKVLFTFWEESGYLKMLNHNLEKNHGHIMCLRELFQKLENFARENHDSSVHAWLAHYHFIMESGDEGEMERDAREGIDAVGVMTAHAAKGLEFEYVFIPDMVEQRFPTMRRSEPIEIPEALVRESSLPEGDAHLEEERRLFYVALTRARKGVFLSAARNYGGVKEKKLSRFISEIKETSHFELQQKISGQVSSPSMPTLAPSPQKIPSLNNLKLPFDYSFSQLQAYQKCPYQYFNQFVLKIPVLGKAVFSFGKTMHRTLQKFYQTVMTLNSLRQATLLSVFSAPKGGSVSAVTAQEIKVPSEDELKKIYKESWQDEWFYSASQKKEYYKKGLEIIKKFHALGVKNGWTVPIGLETRFRFKLEQQTLKGQIDRIDQKPDGAIALIDYKTGKPKNKLDLNDKQQLLLYQLAAQKVIELKNYGPVNELRYYYLEDNSTQSFLGTEEDLASLVEKINQLVTRIKSYNFNPTPGKEVCPYCDFKEICKWRTL